MLPFMRKNINDIQSRKNRGQTPAPAPIACLTAYTAPIARALDAHCDMLLVGDSVAMVLYGEPSTLQADMEMMIRHGRAVVNATRSALVIVDMPFGSYQESKEVAFRNAARILRETGAACVKIEGGVEMAETVAYLASRGVPVMGHVGLQPQSVNTLGGYAAQGREDAQAALILEDARAIAQAGAFALVVEGVAEPLAAAITRDVPCPVIGIGASAQCDGQVLVAEDMLGLSGGDMKKPRFVKEYAALGAAIDRAAAQYAADVRARAFPGPMHVYGGGVTDMFTDTTVTPAPMPLALADEAPATPQPPAQAAAPTPVAMNPAPANKEAPVPASVDEDNKEEKRPVFNTVLRAKRWT